MEIHLYNPWLTYGIGLHRLREAGLLPDIFNYLDERPLTLDELHELCETFFIGDDGCIDSPLVLVTLDWIKVKLFGRDISIL